MAFEQNQQNNFNLNNSLDQVKQWQAELDKATKSIGAEELEAEEELLGVKLKNLSTQQKTRLKQLNEILELEEDGIQELAKLRQALSDRQFEFRKKEIQQEFKLAKETLEKLLKLENENKAHKSASKKAASKKASSTAKDIAEASSSTKTTTSNKSATKQPVLDLNGILHAVEDSITTLKDSITVIRQQAEKDLLALTTSQAVPSKQESQLESNKDESEVKVTGTLAQAATNVDANLAITSKALSDTNKLLKDLIGMASGGQEVSSKETAKLADTENKIDASPKTTELLKAKDSKTLVDSKTENQFTSEGQLNHEDKIKIGEFGFEKLVPAIERLNAIQNGEEVAAENGQANFDFSEVIGSLEKLKEQGKETVSQASLDLAGELIRQAEKAEEAIVKVREFNENKIQNLRLVKLAEEQKLAEAHAKAAYNNTIAKITAYTKKQDIIANEEAHKKEAISKRTITHLDKENQLRLAAIDNETKEKDLLHNKEQYELETRLARENAYADTRNKLTEELIAAEEVKKYEVAHKQELLDQEVSKLRLAHAEIENKARLDLTSAEAKAKDLEFNEARYRAEAQDALKLAHAQEQNKLAEDILKAEEKRKDLAHNKQLYRQEEEAALNKALIEEQNKLTEQLYRTQEGIAHTLAHKQEYLAIEGQKLANEHKAAIKASLLENIAIEAQANDIAQNERKYYARELNDLERAYKKEQNKIALDGIKASAELEYVTKNEAKLQEQELHKLRNEHVQTEVKLRKENIKALARSTDLEKNRAKYLEEAEQKLVNEHVDKQNNLEQGAIDNEAKANDIALNYDDYIFEARKAHENAFYAERNSLLEESFAIEQGILWDKENIDKVMAQELQKKRLGYAKEYSDHLKKAGKYAVDQSKFEKDKARKDNDKAKKEAVGGIQEGLKKLGTGEFSMTDLKKSYGEYMGQRTAELEADGMDEKSAKLRANMELVTQAMGDLAQALDANVRKIAEMQGFVDTRLQGSQINEQKGQSYWKQLLKDAKSLAGASPFIKQEKLVENIKTLVDKGISFDIKQRAFLMTMQEKIANTFNVADGTLLRLIRIQQQDTTAGRLGMESALNSFLNSMYETSEYLSDVASSVRSSLEEMQALMEGAAGTEVEYQVQKWMGSLYSVGMSQTAVQNIAQTLGQIASGDISGLSGSGTGNLLIMAANEAGMSIADILQDGLKADETNKLMQAMVNYLAEIAETSSDSKVVQQQLANVYGIKASDLRAATNLATSIEDVSNQNLAYSGMLGQLEAMMNTISQRTSISEGMTNMWDNVMYSMASTQASNPILYALPKMANLLKDVTGGNGISLPFLNVMGFGVELNTSVAELMMVASMSATALGALGPLITGIADLATGGKGMLARAGIDTSNGKTPVLARGSAPTLQNTSGASISESGLVGNSSGEDIKNATLQDAEDDKKKQMVEAKEEESADDVVLKSQQAVIDIYNLLEEVAHGSQSLRVRVINGGMGGASGASGSSNGSAGSGSSSTSTAGDTTQDGAGTGAGYGKNGADNGNWLLTF